jgi:sterol desaturase/sphingolipid hydroxylase (fatty acid hydroxylase superfamily)
MTFTGLNLLGVLLAFVVSFISGAIWFGPKTFYPVWMKARGIKSGQLTANQNKPVLLFGGTIIGVLVQTLTLGLIINSLQKYQPNLGILDGAGVGFALGVGISMFSSLSHRLFGGENLKVWIIETANDALNLTIAGAIIAYFN